MPAGPVLITSDDLGIATRLVERFDMLEHPTIQVEHVSGKALEAANCDGIIQADLSDEATVADLLAMIRQEHSGISGLIHLSPLSTFSEEDTLTDRARRDCRSLYLLARGLETDINEAATQGHSVLLAATAIDGRLGYAAQPVNPIARAAHGGILGLTKCIGLEWPEVTVRAVDISPNMTADATFAAIQAELSTGDSPLEVGVSETGRITWKPTVESIEGNASGDPLLRKGDVVVMTGGARGITAAMAIGLAERFQAKLILIGRSPLPEQPEAVETAAAATDSEIKAALIKIARDRGEQPKPAQIGRQTSRILATREIRHTLDRVVAAGAEVEYLSVDVSNPDQFAGALRDVESRHGKIAGVVHGAGVIDDKLLRDKTPDSFDRVFGTKVNSTATLLQILSPDSLKFFSLFASVSSRFGNRGQSDYAAANEVLSKVACKLNLAWPDTKVFAVAWGPWAEIGMVADLEKHLTARGLTLIPPTLGVEMFLDELRDRNNRTPEIIIGGGAEQLTVPS